jgi:hypothetical protein
METIISTRKYNSIFRKNLKDKISKLNSKSDYMYIYRIILDELGDKMSINRNGVYFNLNILNDKTIELINNFISDKIDSEINTEQRKIKYESYSKETTVQNEFLYGPKLSNQDKTILKRLHLKL